MFAKSANTFLQMRARFGQEGNGSAIIYQKWPPAHNLTELPPIRV